MLLIKGKYREMTWSSGDGLVRRLLLALEAYPAEMTQV